MRGVWLCLCAVLSWIDFRVRVVEGRLLAGSLTPAIATQRQEWEIATLRQYVLDEDRRVVLDSSIGAWRRQFD